MARRYGLEPENAVTFGFNQGDSTSFGPGW